MPTRERPASRRRDAELNHSRIVSAARAVLAEGGAEVPMRRIAERAGVGVGTLYRHFPDKTALIDAVLDDTYAELLALADAALADPDAGGGLRSFLERAAELHARHRGLRDVLAGYSGGRERANAMRARLRPLVRRLVERAQEAGAIRGDLAPEDVPLVLWSCTGIIATTGDEEPDLWRRFLALLLDGLRPEAATAPLPHAALSTAALDRIAARRHP